MRKLLAFLVCLLPAAASAQALPAYRGSPWQVDHDTAIKNSEPCYGGKPVDGVSYRQHDTVCPPKQVVKKAVRDLLARLGAPQGILEGAKIVFTHDWVICANRPGNYGCSTPSRANATVRLDGTFGGGYEGWGDTLVHEAAHILLERTPIGAATLDGDPFLLAVVTSLGTSRHILPDSYPIGYAVIKVEVRPAPTSAPPVPE